MQVSGCWLAVAVYQTEAVDQDAVRVGQDQRAERRIGHAGNAGVVVGVLRVVDDGVGAGEDVERAAGDDAVVELGVVAIAEIGRIGGGVGAQRAALEVAAGEGEVVAVGDAGAVVVRGDGAGAAPLAVGDGAARVVVRQ